MGLEESGQRQRQIYRKGKVRHMVTEKILLTLLLCFSLLLDGLKFWRCKVGFFFFFFFFLFCFCLFLFFVFCCFFLSQ